MSFAKTLSGHWNLGRRITVYGRNAMHWAVNIHTKRWGYVCFRIPFLSKRELYFYCSPNGTPWASTIYWGRDFDERIRAKIRRYNFGHNFNTDKHQAANSVICNKFDGLKITSFDIERYSDKPETE